MEIYINERPPALPAALAPLSAARVILAADLPQRPRVDQILAQAEQVRAELAQAEQAQALRALGSRPVGLQAAGGNGSTGFTGKGIQTSEKSMDVRGVPPRGSPV